MAKCASTSLTHNDFFPALVGEQTLTRSVILHNNYQEKRKTSFIIEIVFSENQPWVMSALSGLIGVVFVLQKDWV